MASSLDPDKDYATTFNTSATKLHPFAVRRLVSLGLFCLIVLSLTLLLIHLRRTADAQTQPVAYSLPNPKHLPTDGAVHLQARNIRFHVMDGVHIEIVSANALLLPTKAERPVTLDDPESMKVLLLNAESSMDAEDLTSLLNGYALPQAKLPIHSVRVEFKDGELQLKGKVHKLIDLPFSASATVGTTPAGNFHLHFNRITALGFLHKKALELLGIDVADFAKSGGPFRVVDDDVEFPIHVLFPAPHFSGHLEAVKIEDGRLLQQFSGDDKDAHDPPIDAKHYVYLRDGLLDFGRLSMRGVDLQLLNKDGDKAFELSLRDVFAQALPGYLKNLPDHGLVAYIESYDDRAAGRMSRQ